MLAQYLDLTEEYNNSANGVKIELSNYDYCIVQIYNNVGDGIQFKSTLDSGAVQGVTDGNILTSANYQTIAGLDLFSNLLVDTVTSGIFRIDVVGRYLNLYCDGGDTDVQKLLVMLAKIS